MSKTKTGYSKTSRALHWFMAPLIYVVLGLGIYGADFAGYENRALIYALHATIGLTIFGFAIARLITRLKNPSPPFPEDEMPEWQRNVALTMHLCLYFGMFLLPITGWMMASGKGLEITVFGQLTLPHLITPNEHAATLYHGVHKILGYAMVALVMVHTLAGIKILVIDGIKRRTPKTRARMGMLAALVILPLTEAGASAPNWLIDQDQTTVTFSWTQLGAEFTGTLSNITGDIYFAPDNLDDAAINISFPMADATTGAADRDKTFHGADWFDIETAPAVTFSSDDVTVAEGENQYLAKGQLTMKDISRPIDLPFTLTITDGIAHARGRITLDRLDWNIGIGEWRDTSIVKNAVNVEFSLIARGITADEPRHTQ